MEEAQRHVLVVEDDPDVARLLSFNLEAAGFSVAVAATVEGALAKARQRAPQVVVLDLMLLDGSGLDVCRALRADPQLASVGILMLTALSDDADRIGGLEAGADDYVVKPFVVREVVLRVTALAGRVGQRAQPTVPPGDATTLVCGPLTIDLRAHVTTAFGHEVHLRPLELKLLRVLLAQTGKVFSREELLAEVWGLPGDLNTRTVDVHVRRLRVALGAAADVIETVHGFGYRARRDDP